jgi:hypothetical protein
MHTPVLDPLEPAPALALAPSPPPMPVPVPALALTPSPPPMPVPVPAPLPLARRPFDHHATVHFLGRMSVVCPDCHAYHWEAERLSTSSRLNPKFGICCLQGKIKLPLLSDPPKELKDLYERRDLDSDHFLQNIRRYNNSFAMTSVGGNIDRAINDGGGPWIYRIRGELRHDAGGLLPPDGEPPVFAQLYIHDSAEQQINWRTTAGKLQKTAVIKLQAMLHEHNRLVHAYKQAYERAMEHLGGQIEDLTLALRFNEQTDDRRTHNLPTADEVAGVIPSISPASSGARDILLQLKGGSLQRISDLSPLYSPLHYVLLFPRGESGWHPGIPRGQPVEELAGVQEQEPGEEPGDPTTAPQGPRRKKQSTVSCAEYYAFRLHLRQGESDHLFRAGKLYQQYAVDAWATIEQQKLMWLRSNQPTIRSDLYRGVRDALAADQNISPESLGQRTILPSSHIGSPRCMQQFCQDALAINRYYGGGDLFMTVTANPTWPEIQSALFPHQSASDRPDLVSRVFNLKISALMDDIFKKGILGKTVAHIHTTEFQKRGLPHMHFVIYLHSDSKLRTPQDIDSLICAELPDKDQEPELFELVSTMMIHGPCGQVNPESPCMVDGKCSKNFPKPFREETTLSEDGYPSYRRRDTGRTYTKKIRRKDVHYDNRNVVPYCKYLTWKYRCHINMECIISFKSVKYLYKYVYKGPDHTNMELATSKDEITLYTDARYLSSPEAHWHIFRYHMHQEVPNVVRLHVSFLLYYGYLHY